MFIGSQILCIIMSRTRNISVISNSILDILRGINNIFIRKKYTKKPTWKSCNKSKSLPQMMVFALGHAIMNTLEMAFFFLFLLFFFFSSQLNGEGIIISSDKRGKPKSLSISFLLILGESATSVL